MTIDNSRVRFSDAPWYREASEAQAVVGGAGGIGSWLCFFLARMNTEIHLFDHDIIDEPNLGGQLYRIGDIGSMKTSSVGSIVSDFSDYHKMETYDRFTTESMGHSYMFSCFDNMEARKTMFERWLKTIEEPSIISMPCLFIDGRMLAEIGQVYCVSRDTINLYKETLFADSEVDPEACSYKATSHCGAFIASIMTGCFTNHLANVAAGEDIRTVPFKTTFELPLMTFECKIPIADELA